MEKLILLLNLIYLFINYTEQVSVVCDLPKLVGNCKAAKQRYYFDNNTNQCKHFIYGGCGGNGNNFNSLNDCQATCLPQQSETLQTENICLLPKVVGPCRALKRRYFFNSRLQKCELFNYGGCSGNENNFQKLVDCQNSCERQQQVSNNQDKCLLPQKAGMCLAYFPRFFYNSSSSQCQQFIYGGCGGNANNFGSLEECESNCTLQGRDILDIDNSLCSLGEPLKRPFSIQFVPCSRNNPSVCPEDFMCNVTSFNSPGVCCPTVYMPPPPEFNPCSQGSPLKDSRTGKQVFCKFPEMTCPNNYICKYDIADAPSVCCPPDNQFNPSPRPISFSPCQNGEPLFDPLTGQEQTCGSRTGSCPSGYECNTDLADRGAVCCPVVSGSDICNLPMKVGPCKAAIPRYYHNSQNQQCEQFTFGGCQPNENNFQSLDECQRKCFSRTLDICNLPAKSGPCYASFTRYYYNSQMQQCQQFTFGGCQPNANNFASLEECNSRCSSQTDTISFNPCQNGEPLIDSSTRQEQRCGFKTGSCPSGYECFTGIADRPAICCPVGSNSNLGDICNLPAKSGPCFAAFTRYYFNSQMQQCQQFTFGGCQPNANNFASLEECKNRCSSQTEVVPFNPCKTGEPLNNRGTNQERRCGNKAGRCPNGYRCMNSIADRPVCCPVS